MKKHPTLDGSQLKRPYAGAIAPDEIGADPAEAVGRAVAWLQRGG